MTSSKTPIRGVISDFGGVLTTPLLDAFVAFQDSNDIPLEALGQAMRHAAVDGEDHPLFQLERGELTEPDFLAIIERGLKGELNREIKLKSFGETFVRHMQPNEQMITKMHSLRDAGYAMALLTNNVREWEPYWRSMLPVDELFATVVDSAFVGMRKPEPEIYALTLERIGLAAEECVFIDDIELNCDAADALGMHAIHFRDSGQAIEELEAALEQNATET